MGCINWLELDSFHGFLEWKYIVDERKVKIVKIKDILIQKDKMEKIIKSINYEIDIEQ